MFVELSHQTINTDCVVRVVWSETSAHVYYIGGMFEVKGDDVAKLKSALHPVKPEPQLDFDPQPQPSPRNGLVEVVE